MKFISYGRQFIDEEDINSVISVLKSDYLTQGPKILEFEKAICDYTGAKYCVVVNSGTAALHLAIKSLGITSCNGITTPNTFAASSNAMIYNGITPVFVDIDSGTYNIDLSKIDERICQNTKLAVMVHFAGAAIDMELFDFYRKKYNLFVVEDAAHAIGSEYKNGSKVGNCLYSDLTTFSFHPVKTITTGEGGAITTNSEDLYRKLLLLRNHGITKDSEFYLNENTGPWYYEMQDLGFNYRATDFQCALGLNQLKKLDNFINKRKFIFSKYSSAFKNLNFVKIPDQENLDFNAYHLYVVKINFNSLGKSRKEIMNELFTRNIGTQVHYIPIYRHPYYVKNYGNQEGNFPVCEAYYREALSLPIYPSMSLEEVDYVIRNFIEVINE